MKKFAFWLVLLSLGTVVFAGCGEEEKKTAPPPGGNAMEMMQKMAADNAGMDMSELMDGATGTDEGQDEGDAEPSE